VLRVDFSAVPTLAVTYEKLRFIRVNDTGIVFRIKNHKTKEII
jgi:hypothetical protein